MELHIHRFLNGPFIRKTTLFIGGVLNERSSWKFCETGTILAYSSGNLLSFGYRGNSVNIRNITARNDR